MRTDGRYDIDFEAMKQDQLKYIEKLKQFADSHHFGSAITTYGNQPIDELDGPAPVLHIETNATLEDVAKLGERIETEIFGNKKETVYEVVP